MKVHMYVSMYRKNSAHSEESNMHQLKKRWTWNSGSRSLRTAEKPIHLDLRIIIFLFLYFFLYILRMCK